MNASIHPQHSSMIGKCRVPRDFGTQQVTPEQREALERISLETFTDMVNAGQRSRQPWRRSITAASFTHWRLQMKCAVPPEGWQCSRRRARGTVRGNRREHARVGEAHRSRHLRGGDAVYPHLNDKCSVYSSWWNLPRPRDEPRGPG